MTAFGATSPFARAPAKDRSPPFSVTQPSRRERLFLANTLLLVTLSDRTHRSGVVQWRMPGLMIGYIDRFAPEEDAHDLLLEPWIGICREAYRLRLESENVETAK
jgi:hypothetical protein